MKKILLITGGLWLITIIVIIGIINNNDVNEDTYRININRIHSRLSSDWNANKELINNLSEDEKGMISSIKMIDYSTSGREEEKNFFHISNLYQKPAVYLPIEGSNYLVKYSIQTVSDMKRQVVLICIVISIIFISFIVYLIYIYRYILQPMKNISKIPQKLASGYINKLNVSNKNKYYNEFIWGLDMLREQLQKEKKRNLELEKQRRTLVASLSHDIKTPLSSIKNYAIALKEKVYEKPSEQNKALDIILNKTAVVEKLSRELLKSSNPAFSVNDLEIEVEELYMSDIDRRLNQIIKQKIDLLHMEYYPPILKEDLIVSVDLDGVSQVFDNIIENAVKYGDLNYIKVNYHREEYYQCISIENSGATIAESEIKHIFSSYYRGSNVKDEPGYGLGLYICKKMMKAMDGDIYARNTEKGVKFVIVLKLAN